MSEVARNFLNEKCRDKTIMQFLIVDLCWYHGIIKSYDDEYILIEGQGVKYSGSDILLQQRYIEVISIYQDRFEEVA